MPLSKKFTIASNVTRRTLLTFMRMSSNQPTARRSATETVSASSGNCNRKNSSTGHTYSQSRSEYVGLFPRQQHGMTMPANIKQNFVERTMSPVGESLVGDLSPVTNNNIQCLAVIKPVLRRVIRRSFKRTDDPPIRADAVYGETLYKKKDLTEINYSKTWTEYPKESVIKKSSIGPAYYSNSSNRSTNKY